MVGSRVGAAIGPFRWLAVDAPVAVDLSDQFPLGAVWVGGRDICLRRKDTERPQNRLSRNNSRSCRARVHTRSDGSAMDGEGAGFAALAAFGWGASAAQCNRDNGSYPKEF